MMQIQRWFAMVVVLSAAVLPSFRVAGEPIRLHVTVDAGDAPRTNTPVVLTLAAGKELTADQVKQLGRQAAVTLVPAGGGQFVPAQVELVRGGGGGGTDVKEVIVRWVERKLDAKQSREYDLLLDAATNPRASAEAFRFVDGDGYRDLLYGEQPIDRYMTPRYDPADKPTTYKPYLHINGMHDDGFLTKGPGGLDMHHRGVFFGFRTQYGDFWHCRQDESQRHDRYNVDREFTGPVAARDSSVTNWIAKDGKTIARDTREVTAWRTAPDEVLLDFDVTLESLAGDLELGPDPHHGGFHFRASQEVAGSETKRDQGKCTFVRPASAKLVRDDTWSDTPWAAMLFPIQGNPYAVMLMDHPDNPRPTTYSTRGYGRFGAFFKATLPEGKPMHLRYRILVLDGKTHPNPTAEELGPRYEDFVAPPPSVRVVSK
jgi:hypothetical protein